jgi:autotransporter-associated beta strand protein
MKNHARIIDANLRRDGRLRRHHRSLRAEPLEPRLALCAGHVFGGLFEPDPSSPGGELQSLSASGQSWDVGQSFDVLLAASTGRLSTFDGTTTATVAAANGLPDLHSLPRAPTAIYLDFDGDGSTFGAYDVDGDPATFNSAEAASITETHRQTSAYFAMFDVNVTTVKPTVPYAWIVISNDKIGGSSYVGVFPNSKPESWVSSSTAESRVSGVAHELGHNFGLWHQSEYDLNGNMTSEYSNGYDSLHGSIMGVDYRQDVHKWFIGHPSNSASALQDDVAVIAAVIKKYQPAGGDGFRADDFGGTIATASTLTATNGLRSAAGIIERMTDVDTFSFTTGGGGAVISVVPPKPSGLDAKVEVFDAMGRLVAASDGDTNDQQIVLPVGTGTWYVSVSSHGNYGDLGMYDLSVNDLPAGWASADIGNVGSLGDAGHSGGTFTVAGGGTAVGGTADSCRFAWQRLTGDGSIVARVTGNQNTNGWAKAGVEIRESLAANSKHVAMVTTAAQGPQLISRATTGGSSATVNGTAGALTATWVRLVRVGNVITASRSADGASWTTVGSVTVSMSATVYIGLLSSANAANVINEAAFTNVSLTGTINAPETVNSLAAPAGVAVRQGGGASFVVSWQPVSGAAGYVIESAENGVDFTSVSTAVSSATSWTHTGLAGAMRYFYRVRASDAAGRSIPSTIVNAVNRPSPVTKAAVTSLSNSQLVLNWIETSGETGYRIERSTDNVTFTQIATVAANVPSYTASGLSGGAQYWFRISPMSGSGDGNPVVITGSTGGFQAVTNIAFTSKASTAIGLEWTAVTTATGYRIERSTNGTTFTTLATAAAGTTAYSDASVAVLGKYYYRVVALNGTIAANPSPTIFTAAPAAVALPKPWVAADVGSVLGEGATGFQSPKFISVSSGTAIGGAADSFRFTSQPLIGDGSIVAKVSSLENTGGWAKGGVVIRESLDPNARQAVMVVSATNGIAWQYRQNVGGSGVVVAGPTSQTAPAWVKVTRAGNIFTGSWSADGATWTEVGSITISMGITVLAGLSSTSDAAARLNRVEFTDVMVSQITTTDYVASVTSGQTVVETGGLSGAGSLIKRGAGTLVLTGANDYAGGTVVEQGELVIRNVAALGSGRLEVRAGGRVTLDLGLEELALPTLVLDRAGRIDIGAGRLTVAAGLTESIVRQLVVDGRNGGDWNGSRGFVSRAAAVGSRAVGYVFNQGRATVAYAAPGDTNLDGVVDVLDIANLVMNADPSSSADVGWVTGDFNYDGNMDLLDISSFLSSGLFNQGSYLSSMDAAFASFGQEENRT